MDDVIYVRRKRYKLCCTLILLTYLIRDVILLLDVDKEIILNSFWKKNELINVKWITMTY